jgi:hypothetical protein
MQIERRRQFDAPRGAAHTGANRPSSDHPVISRGTKLPHLIY